MSRTYAIPDIHGEYAMMVQALARITENAGQIPFTVVFLGDYIDRGPDSSKVIAHIRALQEQSPSRWITLRGNHEALFVSSVTGAETATRDSWLRHGGRETLESYQAPSAIMDDAEWAARLPIFHEDRHRVYVHAFAPEQFAMPDAPAEIVLWTRYQKGADVGHRGKHVVHGHTPVQDGPERLVNRTNLDCGAVYGGRLVVGVFEDDVMGGPVETIEIS